MTNAQDATDKLTGGTKAYSLHIHAKAQSSNSCSFCWFVLTVYPTLRGMTPRDESTYTAHLQKSHGLQAEIDP